MTQDPSREFILSTQVQDKLFDCRWFDIAHHRFSIKEKHMKNTFRLDSSSVGLTIENPNVLR